MVELTYDQVFSNLFLDANFPPYLIDEYLGDPCLFKIIVDGELTNWIYGRLVPEPPTDIIRNPRFHQEFLYHRFKVADYAFITHQGPYQSIGDSYKIVGKYLEDKNLNIITHPIEVFPEGIPSKTTDNIIVDIWIPTDANIRTKRHSDELPEAFPKKFFNFYQT